MTDLIDEVKKIPNIDPQAVPDRYQVVQLLVLDEVCKRAAADLKATLPPVQTQPGQPALAGLQQSLQNCRENLPVKGVQPTPRSCARSTTTAWRSARSTPPTRPTASTRSPRSWPRAASWAMRWPSATC
ncbi:hypothetical protein ACFQZ4_20640 [Catellatospora coxensis]